MGQPPVDPAQQQQIQQVQQSSKTAMTDLDKIAAQIVGLKQKQQELQQQTQKIGL
jgi:peptidoglycan hydrolase CwlO-like protein